MADEDDLGDFFNEINQIEEIPAVEQPVPVVVNENNVLPHSTTKSVAAVVNVIDSKSSSSASVLTKEAGHQNPKNSELVAVNHAVYTYAAVPSNPENVATDGQSVAGASAASHADSFASSSSSMRKTSIGPSIGPSAPPGPRPPSNSFPHSSSSSGGLNLSLHSFSTSYVTSTAPVAAPQMPKQDKTFVRTGAGEVWIDDSLKDWPENDYRIFVGDLGKETTTEMLAKIFQVYKSFAKAKVIRTKHENKARGFGFVSFMDPMDCAKAIREMQGKYLGTRPMKITRSKWDELDIKQVKKKEQKKRKLQESLGL